MNKQTELERLIEDWSNADKAQAINLLKKSMSETASSTKVEPETVKEYVVDAIKAGFDNKSIPDYPANFSSASRSTLYKDVIQGAIKELGEELHHIDSDNKILQATWNEVEKSRTLVEFRKFFKLYVVALRSELYTKDDIQEYADMIDAQDKEIRQLQEYKRIYNEMFEVLQQDDEDSGTMLRAKQMKDKGLTDSEICKILGITRNKLNYLRKKYVYE